MPRKRLKKRIPIHCRVVQGKQTNSLLGPQKAPGDALAGIARDLHLSRHRQRQMPVGTRQRKDLSHLIHNHPPTQKDIGS